MSNPVPISERGLDALGIETPRYTDSYVRDLAARTFFFGQGCDRLQHRWFLRLKEVCGDRLKPEQILASTDEVLGIATRYTGSDVHQTVCMEEVFSLTHRHMAAFAEIVGGDGRFHWGFEYQSPEQGPRGGPDRRPFVADIVGRDYRFLVEQSARHREGALPDPVSPRRDPYLSHFVYYGLMEQPTGYPEFDTIFRDATHEYTELATEDSELGRQVRAVLGAYLPRHPAHLDQISDEKRALLTRHTGVNFMPVGLPSL